MKKPSKTAAKSRRFDISKPDMPTMPAKTSLDRKPANLAQAQPALSEAERLHHQKLEQALPHAVATILRNQDLKREQPAESPVSEEPALRVQLQFEGSMKHLVAAMAASDQMTIAARCESIIRDNVHVYLESEVSQATNAWLTDEPSVNAETRTQPPLFPLASVETTDQAPHVKLPLKLLRKRAPLAESVGISLPSMKQKEQESTPEPTMGAYAVGLSAPTSELVKWYCGITHHQPAYVVEGIVKSALQAAQENYETDRSDDAFDHVLQDVLDASVQAASCRPQLLAAPGESCLRLNAHACGVLARFACITGCTMPGVGNAAIIYLLESILGATADAPAGSTSTRNERKRRAEFLEKCAPWNPPQG